MSNFPAFYEHNRDRPTGIAEVTGFESRWSSDFFHTSSFQLLKLENLLRWSLFTFSITVTWQLCIQDTNKFNEDEGLFLYQVSYSQLTLLTRYLLLLHLPIFTCMKAKLMNRKCHTLSCSYVTRQTDNPGLFFSLNNLDTRTLVVRPGQEFYPQTWHHVTPLRYLST